MSTKVEIMQEVQQKFEPLKKRNYLNTEKGNQLKVDILIEMLVEERRKLKDANAIVEHLKMRVR